MKISITLCLVILVFFSCKKDEPEQYKYTFSADHGGVYIGNEGNFQSGNATISYFNPANNLNYENPYKEVNKESIGDVCQSMNVINGKLYVVVNNSGKIIVSDLYSLVKENSITGLTSPRFILPLNNTKAYISDGYSNYISIVNLGNNTISGKIDLNGWTEQMLLKNNKVYITNTFSDYLYIINADNDLLEDSILIGKGANSIVEDANGKIRILCGGDYLHTYNGALVSVNPLTKLVEQSISFAVDEFPSRLCTNNTSDSIYFINGGVFKMSMNDSALPALPLIPSVGNNFYGLKIDKLHNVIYVSDAIDYIQNGKVLRYTASGTLINVFLAGIIPGDFIFVP